MKHIFLSLILCAFAFVGNAQVQIRYGTMEDTLTNAETAYLYPSDAATAALSPLFKEFGALQVTITVDSLSGSTAGTSVIEGCYDANCTSVATIATLTMNGATQQVSTTEDSEFNFVKWRVKNTGVGTMSTRIRVGYAWKRKT